MAVVGALEGTEQTLGDEDATITAIVQTHRPVGIGKTDHMMIIMNTWGVDKAVPPIS